MCCILQVDSVHGQDLVPPLEFPRHIGRTSLQDEGHEDALAILSTDDVEPKTRGTLAEDDCADVTGTERGGGGTLVTDISRGVDECNDLKSQK